MGSGMRWRKLISVRGARGVAAAVAASAATARATAIADQGRACCRTVRARSARSTVRTSRASSPRCRSTPARSRVNPNNPRKGWTGGSIGGHPLKLVGIGCSNDKADTAIKETKRLMEQLGADVMIGPLSGDESIAVANYAKQHPNEDVRRRLRRRAGHDAEGAGAELLPLQRRRREWNAGLGDLAYNKLRLEDRRSRRGRLQLRVDVGGRLHRRVLRGRRQGHEAGVPAAEHDRLLVVRAADADERRRHLRRGRRRRSDPVPEGVRAGARARSTARSSSATCSGAPRASSSSSAPASPARTSAAPARRATSQRRRRRTTRTTSSASGSRRSRRTARPRRRRRRRSRTATSSTRGA